MMTTNLFVIANVKQLRTGGSFRILLPFFRTSWGVGVLNSAIINISQNQVEFGTILECLRNFGEGGLNTPSPPPSVRHCLDLITLRKQVDRDNCWKTSMIYTPQQILLMYMGKYSVDPKDEGHRTLGREDIAHGMQYWHDSKPVMWSS